MEKVDMKNTLIYDIKDRLLLAVSSDVSWLPLSKGDGFIHDEDVYTVVRKRYNCDTEQLEIMVELL